jgi:predicted nucleotidyltransferase component of viral defense system
MKRPIRGISDNRVLNSRQIAFLQKFAQSDLKDSFRFTGGTALSAFYLEHRLSEDLDFFSSEKVPLFMLEGWLKTLNFISDSSYTKQFDRNIFSIQFKDSSLLKVEFAYYPLKNIEDTYLIEGLRVDSFLDIIVNKLCAIADRMDAKDYVDIYQAFKKSRLSFEHLMGLAEKKCEIKGIRHILKRRLLQIPEGISGLPLRVEIKGKDIENLFNRLIKRMVEKEIKKNKRI